MLMLCPLPVVADPTGPVQRELARLVSDDATVAARAAEALGQLKQRAAVAVPSLIEQLTHTDERVSGMAGWALTQIGAPPAATAPTLLKMLQRKQQVVREAAAEALVALGRPAVPGLVEQIRRPGREARIRAIGMLGRIGKPAAGSILPLIRIQSDKFGGVRSVAQAALDAIGPAQRRLLPSLLGLARHDDARVRAAAIRQVGRMGRDGRAALPAMVESLADVNDAVQVEARDVLIGFGKRSVGVLAGLLADRRSFVRRRAIEALGKIGPAAAPAVVRMRLLVSDSDVAVRRETVRALGRIGTPEGLVVGALARGLADSDPTARLIAIAALGAIGRRAAAAVPGLIALEKDPELDVRAARAEALGKIGRPTKLVGPALVKALGDPFIIRTRAAEGLRKMGQPAIRALTRSLLDHPKPATRKLVAELLGTMKQSTAVPALMQAMTDPSYAVRFKVHAALAEIGKPAVPALTRALADTEADRAASARKVLRKISLATQDAALKAQIAQALR